LPIKLLMESLRQTILSEAEILNSRSRFGLFSQPAPIALGDTKYAGKAGNYSLIQSAKARTASQSLNLGTFSLAPTVRGSLAKIFLKLLAASTLVTIT
jgi:hypothetical protein